MTFRGEEKYKEKDLVHTMTEKDFEKELNTRIRQVENGMPEVTAMKRRDYIEVAVIAVICLAGIIVGAFL